MERFIATYAIIRKHLRQVVIHNAGTLVNGIFLVVSLLLLIFKEVHEALFLVVVLFFNVVIGIIQDLRAKVALEKLQILMAPKIIRIHGQAVEEVIGLDAVRVEDQLKIASGDQIPTDGTLAESNGMEVNEALLTGESSNKGKVVGNALLAGSVVTSGSGVLQVTALPKDSFVSKMTEKIKQYQLNLSPIQQTLNMFIKYMTYLLLAIIVYVIVHGITAHDVVTSVVKDIAALTSTLIPQGLVLATTIFFAYGAVRMFRNQVLLQEINATEKLGRIKNLCIDKTGTLTENVPVVEQLLIAGDTDRTKVASWVAGYLYATNDRSETGKAVALYLDHSFAGQSNNSLPFSSTRKYGAASLEIGGIYTNVVIGAPDILLNHISNTTQRSWVESLIAEHAPKAQRLLLVTRTNEVPQPGLKDAALEPVGLFILSNRLREGTTEIIDFFQKRGVRIRVISGDNPQTVRAIAEQAGVKNTDIIITGPEMDLWDDDQYEERVPAYHLFSRISPEQKERIVAMLKPSGFTAMVGDGANDALAIKKADLGIAMFDGAGATRQISQIVLMNNNFAALPVGVNLAETIITNIELVTSLFFNSITGGLALFIILAFLGYTYPLSPRNTTIINYCVLWAPLVFWSLFPAQKKGPDGGKSFLKRIVPFSLLNGSITALAGVTVFWLGPESLKNAGSNILVVFTLACLGYWFFMLAPLAYGVVINNRMRNIAYIFAGILAVFLIFATLNPGLSDFFDLRPPSFLYIAMAACITFLFGWIQYQVTMRWFYRPQA